MGIWRKNKRSTRATEARRQRTDPRSKDHNRYGSVEEQIIERLKRMKLPEPPPGAKERALERYNEWLREQQGRQKYRD
jgi:hypothetical protein